MSPDDVCSTCKHPRDRHKDHAGICTATWSKESGGLLCYCNLFSMKPSVAARDDGWLAEQRGIFKAAWSADPRWPHLPTEFLDAMNAVFEVGVKDGRVAGDWMHLSSDEARAKAHNLHVHAGDKEYDAAACNALILWWHFQREGRDAQTKG